MVDFIFVFKLLFMRLSHFHDLDHGFDKLTWLTRVLLFIFLIKFFF